MLRPLCFYLVAFILGLTVLQDSIPALCSKTLSSLDTDIETEIVQVRKRKSLKTTIADANVDKKQNSNLLSTLELFVSISPVIYPVELDNNFSRSGAQIAHERSTAG